MGQCQGRTRAVRETGDNNGTARQHLYYESASSVRSHAHSLLAAKSLEWGGREMRRPQTAQSPQGTSGLLRDPPKVPLSTPPRPGPLRASAPPHPGASGAGTLAGRGTPRRAPAPGPQSPGWGLAGPPPPGRSASAAGGLERGRGRAQGRTPNFSRTQKQRRRNSGASSARVPRPAPRRAARRRHGQAPD